MCFLWRSLIHWIMAASVVLLPVPTAPVTRTRPWLGFRYVAEDRRQVQLLEGRDVQGNNPHDDHDRPALPRDVDAESPHALQSPGRVVVADLFEAVAVLLARDELGARSSPSLLR